MPEPIDITTGEPAKAQGRAPRGERAPRTSNTAKPKPPRVGERNEDGSKKRGTGDLKLKTELAGTYSTIGMAVAGIGISKKDGGIAGTGAALVNHAEAAADAWLDLADRNPKVKLALMRMTEASAIGALVTVHMAILMPLLADRGVVPPSIAAAMGVKLAAEQTQSENGNTPPAA